MKIDSAIKREFIVVKKKWFEIIFLEREIMGKLTLATQSNLSTLH